MVKIMQGRKYMMVATLLTFWITVYAQKEQWPLRHINTKGYVVNTVCHDNDGVLWFATQKGLLSLSQLQSRFPQNYQRGHDSLNACIDYICADYEGCLWMKTLNRDVLCYKPRTNELYANGATLLAQRGINIKKEFGVATDNNHRLWVWRNNRLYWTNSDGIGQQIDIFPIGETLHSLIADSCNLVALTQSRLYYADLQKKSITKIAILPYDIQGAYNMFTDHVGNTWIWAFQTLRRYNRKTAQWDVSLTMPSVISKCVLTADGQLWVGTTHDGIYICNTEGNTLRNLRHDPWDRNSLQNNRIKMLYYEEDKDKVWISYIKGGLSVCQLHQSSLLPHRIDTAGLRSSDVTAFAESPDGSCLYALTADGYLYERDITASDCWTDMEADTTVTSLFADSRGRLWTGNGPLKGSVADAIVEDAQGQIYVALHGKGVWRIDPTTGLMEDTHIGVNYALGMQYRNGRLYAATSEGYFVKDGNQAWYCVKEGQFRSLAIDVTGTAWILGNEGNEGLTIISSDGQLIPVPDELKRAPLRSIALDRNGQMWIVATTGLLKSKLVNGRLETITFSINSVETQLYYNPQAILIDSQNCLWLGSSEGYQCIDLNQLTAQLQQSWQPRHMLIGAISVNDCVMTPRQLGCDVLYTRSLNLSANDNNLVVECMPADDEGFATDTYYYMLEGLDKTWRLISNRAIVLSNLSPGCYHLLTRTQYSEPAELLTINIAQPFWRTWWAWLAYVFMALIVVWVIWRYFSTRRRYRYQLRELQMQQEQQEQMNELKLSFFTNISHDLRTPLTLILGPVEELLKREDLKEDSSLIIVQRNAQHLLSLVNQILDFRRLESKREQLVLCYGDIVSHIANVCDTFRLKAGKDGITFSFNPMVERVETLFDRDKLTKMMMNLLSNAFKFTPTGETVSVGVNVSDDQIIVDVSDCGIGIADNDKAHIFDRFYQSPQTGTDGVISMGSGIGLHIVREYARLQGGDISVTDNPKGKGAVFVFHIPLRKCSNSTSVNSQISNAQISIDTQCHDSLLHKSEADGMSLLLVDDNVDLLNYMRNSLQTDYSILTASNGEQAIQLLGMHDIDIIVSDVMMPVMDGLELCRQVKNNIVTSHISIVLLTAKAMTTDELLGLKAGADDYVTKPFTMDVLRQRLHNLAERNRSRHQRFQTEFDVSPSDITVTSLDEELISRAIALVEEHIADDNFGVEQLADTLGMHRSQLYKKLQHLTGKSPVSFIRLLRLKRGRQLLEQSGMYVSEVAYRVGFSSPRLFSKYFKEEFGVSPKDFSK